MSLASALDSVNLIEDFLTSYIFEKPLKLRGSCEIVHELFR
jgi:hypothetical protein